MFPQSFLKTSDIEALQPKAKPYKVGAGASLYLLVMPNGAKYWRFKYRIGGREKNYAIGVFPDVSLKDARKARNKAWSLLKSDIDPMEVKREEAKHRAKPEARKKIFQMDLSHHGELTIETDTRIVTLTTAQTDALRSFLLAVPKTPERKEKPC